MITLEEYEKSKQPNDEGEQGNGIECPKCKKELYDKLNVLYTCHPPKKGIYCKSCDYIGSTWV